MARAGVSGEDRPPSAGRPAARISVMLFDLDDCLMTHSRAVAHGLDAARTAAGGALAAADGDAELARWRELEEHHYARYLMGELDFLEQRRERVRGFLAPYGIALSPSEALDWFEGYMNGYRAGWALYDDVLPVLETLERRVPGIRFGIVTNGDIAFQTEKLVAIGLVDRIEHVIASGEVGVAKPASGIFLAAARAFGVDVAACAYVGDRLRTDAIGAHDAGMLGLWLDRGELSSALASEAVTADRALPVPRITSLRELTAHLAP